MTAPIGNGPVSVSGDVGARPFTWSGKDATEAGMIAFTLGVLRHVEHGEAVIESSVELQIRPPRLTDAWRFFHAAGSLEKARNTILAAAARRIGARIAMYVTGIHVIDMALCEAGGSAALAGYVEGHELPFITPILHADGRTALDGAR